MSDAAAQIAREAKGLQQGLKELLKNRDISDREIEIQRKNLRRQYLRLLFVHPYARESKEAENHLWMQTSYALIAIYKQRIATLDRAIQHPPRQAQQSSHPPRTVEYRKLLQRFRQFLAEEEKFWTQLVLRLRRHFALDDTQLALTALGIVAEDEQMSASLTAADGGVSATSPRRNQFQFPPELDSDNAILPTTSSQRENRVAILSKALVCLGDIARYKEQYNESGGRPRAGHEDGPPAATSAGKNGRGRRGGGPGQAAHMALPRLRNYDRAQLCYEQARLLLPHDGNPSHQLAILSSYQKDIFSSLVHYYRALCVRQPYDTASENLGNVLNKALEQYKQNGLQREREMKEDTVNGTASTPRLRVEAFKEKVVILHAQWCMNVDEAKATGERVIEDFAGLVADRILPIDMISKVIVLVQGALWKHRMVRRPGHGDKRHTRLHSTESNIVSHLIAAHRVLLQNGSIELLESPPEDAVEHDLAQRITATFRRTLPALRMAGKWLRANTRYISQGRKTGASEDSPSMTPPKDTGKGKEKRSSAPAIVVDGIQEFWIEYTRFSNTLIQAFPTEKLPELRVQLEEDVEMAGFLPLRKYMLGADGKPPGSMKMNQDAAGTANDAPQERISQRDQVHPNEEQLMRISDILTDTTAVAEDENTPLTLEGIQFIMKIVDAGVPLEVRGNGDIAVTPHHSSIANPTVSTAHNSRPQPQPQHQLQPQVSTGSRGKQASEPDEDAYSVTTRTDDDPVRDAFDQVLRNSVSDEEEEDEIVWNPGNTRAYPQTPIIASKDQSKPLSPRHDPVMNVISNTPQRSNTIGTNHPGFYTPHRAEPLSPPRQSERDQPYRTPAVGTPMTTAQDLLINIRRSPPMHHHSRGASAPPMNLLFGTGAPGNSIWSPSAETRQLPFQSGNSPHGLSNGSPYTLQSIQPPGARLPQTHNSWSSSSPWSSSLQSQNAQPVYSANQSTASYLPQHPPIAHRSAPSGSLSFSRSQSHGQSSQPPLPLQYDAFGAGSSIAEPAFNGGMLGRGHHAGFSDPFAISPGPGYYRRSEQDQYNVGPSTDHVRDRSFHTPHKLAPPISQLWGTPG